jgi:hypothetical protein
MPAHVFESLEGIIRREVLKVDHESLKRRPKATEIIFDGIRFEAEEVCKNHRSFFFDDWLKRIIATVLGKTPTGADVAYQPLLPGLMLPEFFSVPSAGAGPAEWVVDEDVSLNQLDRIIEHRENDIAGRQSELRKFKRLRARAKRLKCKPDDPISSVGLGRLN